MIEQMQQTETETIAILDDTTSIAAAAAAKHQTMRYTYLYWRPVGRAIEPFACVAEYQPAPGGEVYIGVSRCAKDEKFNRARGRLIATNRARHCADKGLSSAAWARRLKAGGSAYAEFSTALSRVPFAEELITYDNALVSFLVFCERAGIPVREYRAKK